LVLNLLKELEKYYEVKDIFYWARPEISNDLSGFILKNFKLSKSQLQQDLLALYLFGSEPGFFVEFGATDGLLRSNTYILEKDFGWGGLLVEPAKSWHVALKANRSCKIDLNCVAGVSGEQLKFFESRGGEYSTLDKFRYLDSHAVDRKVGETYTVKTISLSDLLDSYNAPKYIEYISIDTEGSEFEILSSFDFDAYRFGLITVEHNFTSNRESINELLIMNGYTRILEEVSQFDDWYIDVSLNRIVNFANK